MKEDAGQRDCAQHNIQKQRLATLGCHGSAPLSITTLSEARVFDRYGCSSNQRLGVRDLRRKRLAATQPEVLNSLALLDELDRVANLHPLILS